MSADASSKLPLEIKPPRSLSQKDAPFFLRVVAAVDVAAARLAMKIDQRNTATAITAAANQSPLHWAPLHHTRVMLNNRWLQLKNLNQASPIRATLKNSCCLLCFILCRIPWERTNERTSDLQLVQTVLLVRQNLHLSSSLSFDQCAFVLYTNLAGCKKKYKEIRLSASVYWKSMCSGKRRPTTTIVPDGKFLA